jgi:hypothetical protein
MAPLNSTRSFTQSSKLDEAATEHGREHCDEISDSPSEHTTRLHFDRPFSREDGRNRSFTV